VQDEPKDLTPSEEADLRASLGRISKSPSDEHDNVILSAAGRTAQSIRRRHFRQRLRVPVALAASVAALASATLLLRGTWMPPDTLRGSGSVAEVVPALGASLSKPPQQLEWTSVSGADRYEIVLRDSTGRIIGRGMSPASSIWVSDLTSATLPAGSYFWSLRAQGPALDRELGPFHFVISPDQ
jgi:hypothetical protein